MIRLPLEEGRKFFANSKFPVVIVDAGVLLAINKAMVTQTKLKPGKQRGAEANRIKAKATKKAVRELFRKLRKQGFSKSECDKMIAHDLEIDVRTVLRHREGLS